MKTFLIMTEDRNRLEVKKLLSESFDGFTLYFGEGYWVGKTIPHRVYRENNLTIMVLTDEKEVVMSVAREIKKLNNQESVLVVSWDAESEFV